MWIRKFNDDASRFQQVEQEAVDNDGYTPLIYQSNDGRVDIVKYLLEKGADVNAKNNNGYTALHCARTFQVAKTLVEHGADIEAVSNDFYTRTPLILQSTLGNVDIVKYLLSVGANKKYKTLLGKTAYDVACEFYNRYDKGQVKKEIRNLLKEECKI